MGRSEKPRRGRGGPSKGAQVFVETDIARIVLSEFTIKSYNVLAPQYYLGGGGKKLDVYAYVKDDLARDDSHRLQCLIQSLISDVSDIVCLQEVDESWYKVLSEALQSVGYRGEFQPKARLTEGVATFWLSSKFVHVESQCIDVGVIEHGRKSGQRSLMVGLRGKFGYKESTEPVGRLEVTVVNNHLIGHPNLDKERAEQANCVADSLSSKLNPANQEEGTLAMAIVCGDMNSRPGSDMLNVMRLAGYENAGIGAWGNGSGTAYTNGRWATIDHILYAASRMDAIQYVTYDCPVVATSIPNEAWPSDHLPISARFVLHES